MNISDSILETIKKLVGIDKDYGVFDVDLIVAINSSFTILNQLGVGPAIPFSIYGPDETWSDFFRDLTKIELVKSYIYLRARLLFDPPSTGVLHEAIERQISEFEWRLMIQANNDFENEETPSEDSHKISHTELINRNLQNQHSIGAITGLEDKIGTIPQVMTSEELNNILSN